MALTTFLSLPTEIHIDITKQCDRSDIINICLASRQLHESCICVLYDHVRLYPSPPKGLVPWTRADNQIHRVEIPKQNDIVWTLLRRKEYAKYVRRITGTLWVPRQQDGTLRYHSKAPLAETWAVLKTLTNVREVDVWFCADHYDRALHWGCPTSLFSSATSISLGGHVEFLLATSVLKSIDPAKLTHLTLSRLNEFGQTESGGVFDANPTTTAETRLFNGARGAVTYSVIRGLLPHLCGRCTALKSLKSLKLMNFISVDWSTEADEQGYDELAAFLTSVQPSLETFRCETDLINGQPLWEILKTLIPVLMDGEWPRLTFVGLWGVYSLFDDLPYRRSRFSGRELRNHLGDRVELLISPTPISIA